MKNTKFLFLVGSFLLPLQALAATTVCSKDKMERRVEVTPAAQTPCEVKYFKESTDEGSVLWSAKNNAGYCQEKAAEFIQKLQSYGWKCSAKTAPAAAVAPSAGKKK